MAWCDGLKDDVGGSRRLFNIGIDCRCSATTTVCSDKKCPELVGIGNDGYTWTRTPSSDILAYLVQLPSGGIDANYRNGYFGYYYAVCK